MLSENMTFMVQCEFMTNSSARGCMVVLISTHDNETMKLIRSKDSNSSVQVVNIKHPPSCYQEVVAYDVESDGSIGSLPVHGTLMVTEMLCTPRNVPGKLSVKKFTSVIKPCVHTI